MKQEVLGESQVAVTSIKKEENCIVRLVLSTEKDIGVVSYVMKEEEYKRLNVDLGSEFTLSLSRGKVKKEKK